MDKIFQDEDKLKIFVRIQEAINNLKPNSREDEIDQIIKIIPNKYLNQKDELMTICQLFAYYARFKSITQKGNAIKLFQRILTPIKTLLQDESIFIWNIFGGLMPFKLWMYEEKLICIDQILQSAQIEDNNYISEFFYPEILEAKPKIFENVTKYQLKKEYSENEISSFKKLRKDYFNWLLNSGDYKDPSYLNIEKDQLRLSIKLDDFDTFQKILSNSNISINSKIQESILENDLFVPHSLSLIEYAITSGSINIVKFLLLNNAEMNPDTIISFVIRSQNYELIHIIESKLNDKFIKLSLYESISSWNNEMIDYVIDNYDYEFLFKSEVNSDKKEVINEVCLRTFYSLNFSFFESTLLPFLRKNEKFVSENMIGIISPTFYDMSCHFTFEFLKYPNININDAYEFSDENESTLLGSVLRTRNFKAFEFILNRFKDININYPVYNNTPAFKYACRNLLNLKFLELLINYNDFDLNITEIYDDEKSFDICVMNCNYMALEFLINHFPKCDVDENFSFYYYVALTKHNYLLLKIELDFLFKVFYNSNINDELVEKIIEDFDHDFEQQPDYDDKYTTTFRKILFEMKNQMMKK